MITRYKKFLESVEIGHRQDLRNILNDFQDQEGKVNANTWCIFNEEKQKLSVKYKVVLTMPISNEEMRSIMENTMNRIESIFDIENKFSETNRTPVQKFEMQVGWFDELEFHLKEHWVTSLQNLINTDKDLIKSLIESLDIEFEEFWDIVTGIYPEERMELNAKEWKYLKYLLDVVNHKYLDLNYGDRNNLILLYNNLRVPPIEGLPLFNY